MIDPELYDVDPIKGCWIWKGGLTSRGYGAKWEAGKSTLAYNWAYKISKGDIPRGHELHHTCGIPRCINPEHLTPLTHAEHKRLHMAQYTHCHRGHPITPENTYIIPSTGTGRCYVCMKEREQRRRKQGGK